MSHNKGKTCLVCSHVFFQLSIQLFTSEFFHYFSFGILNAILSFLVGYVYISKYSNFNFHTRSIFYRIQHLQVSCQRPTSKLLSIRNRKVAFGKPTFYHKSDDKCCDRRNRRCCFLISSCVLHTEHHYVIVKTDNIK